MGGIRGGEIFKIFSVLVCSLLRQYAPKGRPNASWPDNNCVANDGHFCIILAVLLVLGRVIRGVCPRKSARPVGTKERNLSTDKQLIANPSARQFCAL